MTQHEALHTISTAGLSTINHGSTQWKPNLGGTTIELGDVGYIHHHGTFVKLFNASKGLGNPSNCHGLPSGHDPWAFDDIPCSMRATDLASKVTGTGDMRFSAGRQVESSKRQDKSQNITSREGAIEEKRFAEYLQRNNDSWLNFASELGHNVPPSGLVFVTGCDQTLACAAAIDSHSSTGLKIFISIGGSAKGWESFAVEMGSQSPDSPGPRSMLSYASSFVYGAAMAIFSFALQWPSKQQTTCHDRDAFLRTEHDASWLHPKLLVQSIESSIGAKDILHEREDTMTQGTNTEQTQFSSSEQDYLSQGSNDDKISRVPQSVEDPDSGSEQVGTSQIYEEQHEGLPMEELMGFIFENSTAERVLVHDDDFIDLVQNNPDRDTRDFKSWIHDLHPHIYVDANGMFKCTHNLQTRSSTTLTNYSLPDITGSIQNDSQHLFSIDCSPVWDVFGATCNVVDSGVEHDDLNVIIKVLTGTSDQKEKIDQRLKPELARWHHLKHPNVAELLGVARLLPERPLGSVTKRVENPNLLTYIGIHPDLKLDKAKEIVDGIQYLHDQGVIHGDLKVDNIIIADNGQAQISDFGIAQILDASSYMTLTQTNTRFTAPELMPVKETDPSDVRPTRESDIFSVGMLLLQLFHGPDKMPRRGLPYNHIPSSSGYDIGMVKSIHAGERPRRTRYNQMEDKHWNLIRSCWDGEPSQRPTITQVRHAL